jgi:hypothetical protein
MAQSKSRKRLYRLLGLLTLLYIIFGSCVSFTTLSDPFGTMQLDIGNQPPLVGIFVLVTGIPVFLLFLFLERRVDKNDA